MAVVVVQCPATTHSQGRPQADTLVQFKIDKFALSRYSMDVEWQFGQEEIPSFGQRTGVVISAGKECCLSNLVGGGLFALKVLIQVVDEGSDLRSFRHGRVVGSDKGA